MNQQIEVTIESPCSICAASGELMGELGTCKASAYPHCEDCHINEWQTCKYVDVDE